MRVTIALTIALVSMLGAGPRIAWCVDEVTLVSSDWPQFGGPRRDFNLVREEVHPSLLSWPEAGPRVLWQRELGDGYAGVVVSDNTLVTMFRKDDAETIIALDANSGRELWRHSYDCPFEGWEYGSGAFSTPTIVDRRVYCVGIMANLHCLDVDTGAVIWQHDLVREFGGRIPGHGYGCSPLAVENLIVLSVGGPVDEYTMEPISENSAKSVFAFDQLTGEVVWRVLNHRIRHASPLLVAVKHEQQLVLPLYEHVVGLHPVTGALIWSVEIPGHTNVCATPVWHAELQLLICANSYGAAKGIHAIRLSRNDDRTIATRVWDNARVENWHASMVLHGEELIVSAGGGPAFLMAVNLADDGAVLAKQRGFGKTNIVKLADRFLLLDERGKLALARRSDDGFDILGTQEVLAGRCWTAPTVVGDTIYVRNRQKMKALKFQ